MTELTFRPQDDEIKYRVTAQKVVTQEDVRVAVPVTALVSAGKVPEDELERRIRGSLEQFIAADWQFSMVERLGDAVGFERVVLTAWTRVPHPEIYNLAERARRASSEGLSLGEPTIDYSVPFARLAQVTHELRMDILDQAQAQRADYERRTGRAWRIGSLHFGTPGGSGQRTGKGAYRSEDSLEVEDGRPLRGVTGSERVEMVAEVILRSAAA